MSTNKNAVLRYRVLDKCFRNTGRKYYFRHLLDAVNEALAEDDPSSSGIQMRQLRSDISFMKSGYAAPIVAYRDGKRSYYRYEDAGFSINQSPLNATEAEQLKNTISILRRFEGNPGFEWIREMAPMLSSQFGLKSNEQPIMAFESNIDYSGYEYISPIFNAIVNMRVLRVEYEPFSKGCFASIFHPHYLKQFNNRWFVFGYNEDTEVETWNFALDRIISLNETDHDYKKSDVDWEEHFYDIIGVTKPMNAEPELVELEFQKEQAPYILTRPLHPSQKNTPHEDGTLTVRLDLIPNFELQMLLLSFGEKVKVISPDSLKYKMKERLEKALTNY